MPLEILLQQFIDVILYSEMDDGGGFVTISDGQGMNRKLS